jgi:hypothetical protein
MHYLCHAGSLTDTAPTFGMSKSTASRCVWQVIDIINHCFTISLPATEQEWKTLRDGFKAICRFPNTYLAVDGSLFEINSPDDYEGWYCHKGFPLSTCRLSSITLAASDRTTSELDLQMTS